MEEGSRIDALHQIQDNPLISVKKHVQTRPFFLPGVLASMVPLRDFSLEREFNILGEGSCLCLGLKTNPI